MQGRDFLELARELLPGTHPRHWRAAVIHAYYSLLLECREAMRRWGLPPLQQYQVHAQVRLRFAYSSDNDLQLLADSLDALMKHRNLASYDLRSLSIFATGATAWQDVAEASSALALLDRIDNDPVRRAAAIASIRP